eukprot:1157210-Pelagomonas_calceolata.AAC.13
MAAALFTTLLLGKRLWQSVSLELGTRPGSVKPSSKVKEFLSRTGLHEASCILLPRGDTKQRIGLTKATLTNTSVHVSPAKKAGTYSIRVQKWPTQQELSLQHAHKSNAVHTTQAALIQIVSAR